MFFLFSYLAAPARKTTSPAPYASPRKVGGLLGFLFPNLNRGK